MGILSVLLIGWIAKKTIGEETYWFLVAVVGGALLPPRGIFTPGAAPFVMLLCTLALLAVAVYTEHITLRSAVPFAVVEMLVYVVLTVAAKWPGLPLLKDNLYHIAQPWWRRNTGYVHRRLAGVSVEKFRALREAGAVPAFGAMMEAAELGVQELTLERPATRGGNLAVHLIAPRTESSTPRPLIVYIHGGGMVLSSAEDPGFAHLMTKPRSALCDVCAIASVSYRLAPEHPFPCAADDVFETLEWLLDPERAAEHGYSTTNVSVLGISAGANLAAGLAVRAAKAGITITAQLLVIPMLKFGATTASYREFGDSCVLGTEKMIWFWEQYAAPHIMDSLKAAFPHVSREQNLLCCPGDVTVDEVRALRPNSDGSGGGVPLAPAIIVVGTHDPLRDEGREYAATLQAAEVDTALMELQGSHVGSIAFDTEGKRAFHVAAFEAIIRKSG